MLAEQPQIISLTQLAVVAGCSRDHITQLYLHWTAGRYGQVYDDYHLNIDADGSVYQTCTQLTELKSHTWHRNTGAIGIALCCACGALPHNGRDTEFGKFPPTPQQIDAAGILVAKRRGSISLSTAGTSLLTAKPRLSTATDRTAATPKPAGTYGICAIHPATGL